MFEPQDHPDDIPYPGAPPTRAVRQRRLHARVPDGRAVRSHSRRLRRSVREADRLREGRRPARSRAAAGVAGYYFIAQVERQLHRRQSPARGQRRRVVAVRTGRWATARSTSPASRRRARSCRRRRPISASASKARRPRRPGTMSKLRTSAHRPRSITYGGGMPVGWTRLIFKNFECPFVEGEDDVFPPMLERRQPAREVRRAGLQRRAARRRWRRPWRRRWWRRRGDAPPAGGDAAAGGAVAARAPARRRAAGGGRPAARAAAVAAADAAARRRSEAPATIVRRRSSTTRRNTRSAAAASTPATLATLKQFVQDGGTIVAIGSAANGAIQLFKLPLTNHLVADGQPLGAHRVLRAWLSPARRGRSEEPARARLRRPGGHLLRQQPGVEARRAAGAGANLRAVAWFNESRSRCAAAGPGARSTSTRASQMAEANVGTGPRVPVRQRAAVPLAAARHLQVLLQRDLLVRRAGDEGGRGTVDGSTDLPIYRLTDRKID